jgi:hypothetical protein
MISRVHFSESLLELCDGTFLENLVADASSGNLHGSTAYRVYAFTVRFMCIHAIGYVLFVKSIRYPIDRVRTSNPTTSFSHIGMGYFY